MTAQEILFGENGIRRVHGPTLAKAIGVSSDTIRRWRHNPDLIPYNKLKLLIRVQNIPDDQVQKLMRMR